MSTERRQGGERAGGNKTSWLLSLFSYELGKRGIDTKLPTLLLLPKESSVSLLLNSGINVAIILL